MTSTVSVNLPRIVFTSHPGGNNGSTDTNAEIYSMNADGAGQTRLTNNRFWDSQPTASQDGKRIAFASNRTGNSQIYAMNADGSDVMRLTNTPPMIRCPSSHPMARRSFSFPSAMETWKSIA